MEEKWTGKRCRREALGTEGTPAENMTDRLAAMTAVPPSQPQIGSLHSKCAVAHSFHSGNKNDVAWLRFSR